MTAPPLSLGVVGWTIALLAWSMGLGTCNGRRMYNVTPFAEDSSGSKRHFFQFGRFTDAATGGTPASTSLLDYGCWCGPGGDGKVVDDLDLCCKVHDNCYGRIEWMKSCSKVAASPYTTWFKLKTVNGKSVCDDVASYGTDPEAQCKYDLCYCDWIAAQCFGKKKAIYNAANEDYNDKHTCSNSGNAFTKTQADIGIMIQVSHSISDATITKSKLIAEKLIQLLDSTTIDCKFAFGAYATTRRMSVFRDATTTVSAIRTYPSSGIGKNTYTEYALQLMRSQYINPRTNEGLRGGDAAKIVVLLTDGVSEVAPDKVMTVYRIAKEAKEIKDNSVNIKIVGALIPTSQRIPRIDELQSVVSEPSDAVDAVPTTATADKVAKQLAFRVERWIRPVLYKVKVKTSNDWWAGTNNHVFIRIFGKKAGSNEEQGTAIHFLYKPSSQGNPFETGAEDEFQFADGDVGVVSRVGIQKQTSASVWGYLNDNWTLEKVTVTIGTQTKVVSFNKEFANDGWHYAGGGSADSSEEGNQNEEKKEEEEMEEEKEGEKEEEKEEGEK